jgi:hypothetical protein
MDSSSLPLYKVVETDQFLERAAAFFGGFERWDEIKETIDFDLARNPHVGQPVLGTELYAVQINIWPPTTLYYAIDDDKREMELRDMRQFDPPAGQKDW